MGNEMTAKTTANENEKWSDNKKMKGDDILRTLECLRGRLLAERQASNVAKEEAQLMGNKLLEIENKLIEETKLRRKAEKKLKFLMKKLESLNISFTLKAKLEELLSSPEICGFSCTSSFGASGSKTSAIKSQLLQDMKESDSAVSIEEDSITQHALDFDPAPYLDDSLSDKSSHHLTPSCQSSTKDFQSCSNSDATVDNSLALVAMNFRAPNNTREVMMVNNGVNEVLDALRHAREKIQGSIARRRHMIGVGPP